MDDDDAIDKLAKQAIELLNAENTVLPMLQKQYAEAEKSISNLLYAMEQGIITPSTKARMRELKSKRANNMCSLKRNKWQDRLPPTNKSAFGFATSAH